MSTCDDACVNNGVQFLKGILDATIVAAYCTPETLLFGTCTEAINIEARLSAGFNTLKCNIQPSLSDQITLVKETATNTVARVNTAYIVVIFVTFLLLVIFIYVTIIVQSQIVTIVLFILSILIIIAAVALLYFWLQSIYNSAGQDVVNTLNNVVHAGQEGLCCLGATCGACLSC